MSTVISHFYKTQSYMHKHRLFRNINGGLHKGNSKVCYFWEGNEMLRG